MSELAACLVVVRVIDVGSVGPAAVVGLPLRWAEEKQGLDEEEEDMGRTEKKAVRHGNTSRRSQGTGVGSRGMTGAVCLG